MREKKRSSDVEKKILRTLNWENIKTMIKKKRDKKTMRKTKTSQNSLKRIDC